MEAMHNLPAEAELAGLPELTELGKRIEVLRIERGLSKQHLARFAGTSRQQLWRVMTGKSQLTLALRERLADVLKVSTLELDASPSTVHFVEYAFDASAIARTLATMPVGDSGRALKRRFLDAIEDLALERHHSLDARFFEVRRQVLNGEL